MGRYEGSPIVKLLDDGRRVALQAAFAFIDDDEQRWDVPAEAIVDGASIPKVLWSMMGGPFEGRYRDASIVHDWYCDLRSRPWRDVHRMFYNAMLASGVNLGRAKLMYAGVYARGPRWSETVISNIDLLAREYLKHSGPDSPMLHYPMLADEFGAPGHASYKRKRVQEVFHYDITDSDLEKLSAIITDDVSLDEIERAADSLTANMVASVDTERQV